MMTHTPAHGRHERPRSCLARDNTVKASPPHPPLFHPACPAPSWSVTPPSSRQARSSMTRRPGSGRREAERLEARLAQHRLARKSSSLGWMFGRRDDGGGQIRGCYIFGDVGRGKTMLMDLFFAATPVATQAPHPFPRVHARRARARACLSAAAQARRGQGRRCDRAGRRAISRTKRGSCASTNSTSPTSPTR